MRNTFINTVLDACSRRNDIFIISGDAGLGVFDEFKEKYPSRFLNLGVAEQNTISFAAGLAMSGKKVFVYNIIPFLLYRCYEQVRNDICYQRLPVTLVGIGSGVTYAPMGMSHYSIEDIGIIQTLPNLAAISPMDPVEAEAAAHYAIKSNEPVYVRLAKRGEPIYHSGDITDICVPQVVREGNNFAIVFHGSISDEVMVAYEILKENGHSPLLVSIPMIQPLDISSLYGLLSEMMYVFCVEEHFISCGLGSMLSRFKTDNIVRWKLINLGIPNRFIHEIRNTKGLRIDFGISASKIAHTVKTALKENGGGCNV